VAVTIPVIIDPKIKDNNQSLNEFQNKMDKYFEKLKGEIDNLFDDISSTDVTDKLKKRFDDVASQFSELRKKLNYAISSKDAEGVKEYTLALEKMQYALKGISDTYKYANKDSVKTSGYYNDIKEMTNLQAKVQKELERTSTEQGKLDLSARLQAEKNAASEAATQAKEASVKMKDMASSSEASVKRMSSSFKKLGSIIKESFVSSIKTATTAVKKYFGLLAKAGKSIFNLIKKGFGGGSESSNPLINMFKKGIVFYGVKKLIGELQNFISTTANIGTVADSAFAQYNGHLASVKENLRTLGTIGATGLIQMLTPILNVLNFITSAAVNAAYAIADLLGFGGTARKAVAGYNAEAKAISGVGAAANKATLGLQSFDKLNNTMSDKGSGGGGGGGIANAIEGIPYEDNKVIKWLKGLFDLLSDKKWQAAGEYVADGINSVSDALYNLLKGDKIEKKLHKFNDGLTDFFKGLLKIDTNKIGKNIGLLVNKITYAITDLYNQLSGKGILKGFGAKISQFFNGLFDEVDFRQLGQALMVKFKMVFEVLRGFLDDAKKNDLGTKLGTSIKNFILGILDMIDPDEIGSSLGDMLNLGFDALIALLGGSDGISLGKEIGGKIVGIFNTAIQTIDPKKMSEAFSSVLSFFGDLFGSAKDWDTDTLSDNIANAVNDAANNGSLTKIAEGIATFFGKLVGLLAQTLVKIDWIKVAQSLWQGIVNAFDNLSDEDKEAIVDVLKTIFEIYVAAKAGLWVLSSLGKSIMGAIGNGLFGNEGIVSSAISSILGGSVVKTAAIAAVAGWGIYEYLKGRIEDALQWENYKKQAEEVEEKFKSGNIAMDIDILLHGLDDLDAANQSVETARGKLSEFNNEVGSAFPSMNNAISLANDYATALEAMGMPTDTIRAAAEKLNEEWSKFGGGNYKDAVYELQQAMIDAEGDFESFAAVWDTAKEDSDFESFLKTRAANDETLKTATIQDLAKLYDSYFIEKAYQNTKVVDENKTAGTEAAQAYIDSQKDTLEDGSDSVQKEAETVITDSTTAAKAEAIKGGKEVSEEYVKQVVETINTDTTIQTAVADNITKSANEAKDEAKTGGETLADEYLKAFKDKIASDATMKADTLKKLKEVLSSLVSDVTTGSKEIGLAVIDGIIEGVNNNAYKLTNKLKEVAKSALKSAKTELDIHSPSKVFRDEVGQNIVLGMIEGISDEEMAVQDEMQNIRDVIMQPFDKRDMSEYFDFSGIPSSIVVNPSVNKARLQSGMESSGSTAGILGSLGMLGQKAGRQGQKVQVSVYLDANNKLGDFILDTVSGKVVKGGNF
jgi:hypothetical protein